MNINETIKSCFNIINADNGTEVYNKTQNKTFTGLVTSGDFMATFNEFDQDNELNFQVTVFNDDCPKTGDILIINDKKFIVQSIQSRINGVLSKITVYETRSKK